jgi:hypothetical protein
MAVAAPEGKSYSQVLLEVFDIPERGMSEDLARSILQMRIPESKWERLALLNEKANEGTLSEAERAELEVYANVEDLLAYWQANARRVLSRVG